MIDLNATTIEDTAMVHLTDTSIVQWGWARELLLDVIETRRSLTEDKFKELANVMRQHLTTRTLAEIKEWCEDNQTRVDRAPDDNIQVVEVDELIAFLEAKNGA